MPATRTHRLRSSERRRGIELLLAEDVANLGQQGEIVRVKPGYARNFLVPQGLATVATEENKARVAAHREAQEKLRTDKIKKIQKLAKDISNYSATIEANANDEGHLYGSVMSADISRALRAGGFDIPADQVRIEGPLKELGMYTVKVQLHAGVETDLKVWVVPAAKK